MKQLRVLFLALALMLTACGNGTNQTEAPTEVADTTETTETDQATETTAKEATSTEENPTDDTEEVSTEKTSMTVTDLAGNEVTFDGPLDKIIVQGSGSGGPFMMMMYLDNDNFLDKIAAMDSGLEKNRKDFYDRLVAVKPELADLPSISDFKDNDFSVEAILNAGADGIIAPISYKAQIETIQNKIDIPVFYVDYHSEEMENHIASTKLIAEVTGLDKNLDELLDFYISRMEPLLAKDYTGEDAPSIYIEVGFDGPQAFSNSYGSNIMWGKVVSDLGGHNIGSDVLEPSEAVALSEEYIISQNPDKIIITGSQWPAQVHSMKMGFDTTPEEVEEKIEEYRTVRTGWQDLDAFKNKEVYVLGHQMMRDMSDFYSYQAVAKILHPEEYKDLDPDADLKEFYEKFVPFELEGLWSYKYGEE